MTKSYFIIIFFILTFGLCFLNFFFRVKGNTNNSKGKEQAVNKDVDNGDDVGDGDNDWMKNGSPYNAATGMCKSHSKIDFENCNLRNKYFLGLIFLETYNCCENQLIKVVVRNLRVSI